MTSSRSPFPEHDLTADKFEALLHRLDPDREQAGQKYEEIRWKLIRFFQWNSCFDAEDLVDETFNRVAEKIVSSEEEIQNVAGFVWGIAKNIRHEALRNEAKTVRLPDLPDGEDFLADHQVAPNAAHELTMRKGRAECLRKCMQALPPRDRRVLLTYHSPRGRYPEARRWLAEQNGITMLALRVRVTRLRFKLEECIRKCLAGIAD